MIKLQSYDDYFGKFCNASSYGFEGPNTKHKINATTRKRRAAEIGKVTTLK